MADDGLNEDSGGEGPSEKVKSHPREEREDAACFDPKNLVGETLDGRYELFECIGRGGMGVVYLATQSALDRDVVVKVLPPSFVDDKEALARFEREARGMSRLQHPHIVSIYDFGYHDDQAYIVMEYVEGHTLRRIIKSGQGGELTTFGSIALQILEGISEAHSLGMVHRDIKPANIMLTERRGQDNYVKILDFGLAKLVKGSTDVTKEQTLVGSVSYLAPEQIMGNDTDQRVDVYALGVLFYYMLAGEKPFSGEDDVAVLYQHVHNQPERLETKTGGADIPRSVIELVHQALSKDPDNRPEDAGAFLDAMKRCLAGTDISAPHTSGEFESIAGSGMFRAASPEDPSDRLDRERYETPIYQGSVDSHLHESTNKIRPTPTPTGVSGEQLSWVTGEHMLKVEKQNRLRNILLGMLGAFVIGGGGIFLYMNTVDRSDDGAASSEAEQALPSEADQPALTDEAEPDEAEPAEAEPAEAEPAEAEPAEAEP
ncbi:MAG: serine/threonine protein kinase, partial [Persicimonas sp.]